MAITIKFDEDGRPQAVCDSVEEAIQMMKSGSSQAGHKPDKSERGAQQNGNLTSSTSDKAKLILGEMNDKSKKLLWSLAQFPAGVEAGELSVASGIDQAAFGGLNGALSKIADNHGLSFEKFVKSEAKFRGKGKDKERYRWMAPTKLLLDHADCVKV